MRLPSVLAAVLATLAAAWAALRAYGLDAATAHAADAAGHHRADRLFPLGCGRHAFRRDPRRFGGGRCRNIAVETPGHAIEDRLRFSVGRRHPGKRSRSRAPGGRGRSSVVPDASRQLRAAFRFFHPACLLAFAAAAVPWYALCTARNPDFFRVFFIEHNLQRYLTPVFQHPQPFWFFAPVLLAAVFPWTALVAPLILDASRALKNPGEWRDSPSLFFGCWVIAPLLFFSFSESKLPGYILPAVPPLVLLLAATLSRRLSPDAALVARVAGPSGLHVCRCFRFSPASGSGNCPRTPAWPLRARGRRCCRWPPPAGSPARYSPGSGASAPRLREWRS